MQVTTAGGERESDTSNRLVQSHGANTKGNVTICVDMKKMDELIKSEIFPSQY